MTEEWRPIPGFAGYFASSLGRIASKKRGKRRILRQWVVRSPYMGKSYTYPAVCLHRDRGRTCHRAVGRYVLVAFTGTDDPKLLCLHKDGDPFNNKLDNLTWGTAHDNARDRKAHHRG